MNRKLDFTTVVMVLVFVGAVCLQTLRSFHWGHDNFGMTEWLINYAGGFVRRGLPGTMIYWVALRTEIQANYIAIFFSVATFGLVLAFFLIRARRFFPVALILSPVLLGAPAYQNQIIRKDLLGILLLIVCLAISEAKWKERTRLILINLIAVMAILSHETFFSFGLPILIWINIKPVGGRWFSKIKELMLAVLKFLPSFFALAMAVLFRGNAMVANAINDSWHDLWGRITPGCCFEKPGGAIDAIGWSMGETVSLTAGLFTKFSMGIYIPLAWLTMIVISFVVISGFLTPEFNGEDKMKDASQFVLEKKRLVTIMIFQLVVISPLLVPYYDVGRLIFFWVASSLAVFLIVRKPRIAYFEYIEKLSEIFLRSGLSRLRLKPWYLLFFGVPGCCWSVYVFFRSTPIGFGIVMLAKLLIRIFSIQINEGQIPRFL